MKPPVAPRRRVKGMTNRWFPEQCSNGILTVGSATENVTVAVRVLVVLSLPVLLVLGPDTVRRHVALAVVILFLACLYGFVTAVRRSWDRRRSRSAAVLSMVDAVLASAAVATMGGAESPAVAVLFLVLVGAAIRLPITATAVVTTFVITALVLIALFVDPGLVDGETRLLTGVWWTLYLALAATLAASLSLLAEREERARTRALVELEAEHAVAEEERDLQARLLESYQTQQDGLRAILHEFRTPVVSLDALAKVALAPSDRIEETERINSLHLIMEHAGHLTGMLNALSDVAASRTPGFGDTGDRLVDMRSAVEAAADAARLPAERLRLRIDDDAVAVRIDGQRLRRVITNLLENAERHGAGKPVDVEVSRHGDRMVIAVCDRGPGVAQPHLTDITAKDVSLGDRKGTAGLGLWIVVQILQVVGGSLRFANREGGGLVARCEIPLG